jgi:hypothetical protein
MSDKSDIGTVLAGTYYIVCTTSIITITTIVD